MKIVIAPDSFKESLTAKQVCQSIENGLKRVWHDAQYVHIPVADGGEGTVQSLVDATGGKIIECQVTDPLGSPVNAFYGKLGGEHDNTAVIEMAAASGLHHVPSAQRDPKITTSLGTGELIVHALKNGAKKLIIGLGGSATNDGGMGMLEALGIKFLDSNNHLISGNGIGLTQIKSINIDGLHPQLADCEIVIASDVDNPLCGEQGATATFGKQKGATPNDITLLDQALNDYADKIEKQLGKHVKTIAGAGAAGGLGATATFGKQKGATPDDIKLLDQALNDYADKIEKQLGKRIKNIAGAGAAGGLGAAFLGFTNATLKPGIEIVLETLNIDHHMQQANLVFTGEGRIDWQSAHGKTPVGVAQAAKKYNVPVIALAGGLGDNYQAVYEHGINAVFSATPRPIDLETAFTEANTNMANLAENIARIWKMAQAYQSDTIPRK